MTCASCTGAVEDALRSQPGVQTATVQLLLETADVKYDETKVTGMPHARGKGIHTDLAVSAEALAEAASHIGAFVSA